MTVGAIAAPGTGTVATTAVVGGAIVVEAVVVLTLGVVLLVARASRARRRRSTTAGTVGCDASRRGRSGSVGGSGLLGPSPSHRHNAGQPVAPSFSARGPRTGHAMPHRPAAAPSPARPTSCGPTSERHPRWPSHRWPRWSTPLTSLRCRRCHHHPRPASTPNPNGPDDPDHGARLRPGVRGRAWLPRRPRWRPRSHIRPGPSTGRRPPSRNRPGRPSRRYRPAASSGRWRVAPGRSY